MELVAMSEVAALLGVSRQRVQQLQARHADFPAPVADLSVGRIWQRDDIEKWAASHGRTIHP